MGTPLIQDRFLLVEHYSQLSRAVPVNLTLVRQVKQLAEHLGHSMMSRYHFVVGGRTDSVLSAVEAAQTLECSNVSVNVGVTRENILGGNSQLEFKTVKVDCYHDEDGQLYINTNQLLTKINQLDEMHVVAK